MREPIPLSNAFFAVSNVSALQTEIRQRIKQRLGYIIGNQSEEVLFQVMVGVYREYAACLQYDVAGQVRSLNKVVISKVLPTIAVNIKQRLNYLKDMSGAPTALPLPEITSNKGTQTVPTFQGF